jgi:hypothetical protein
MDLPHGFFRFALNQTGPKPLAQTAGFMPEALYISPDKSEVYADANGAGSYEPHLIYNAKADSVRDLGPLIAPYSTFIKISPDWHYVAWTNFRDPGLHIVDLNNNTMRTFHLPSAVETGGLLMVTAWSADGNALVTRRPWTDRQSSWTYWKINPNSGQTVQIQAQNPTGPPTYMENGAPVSIGCGTCDVTRLRNPTTTPSGALVYISVDRDLVVKDPDGSLNILAKHIAPPPTPPGGPFCLCGPEGKYPMLLTIFDGDVLLYSFGPDLFVYGIAEHKISPLGVAPIELVF